MRVAFDWIVEHLNKIKYFCFGFFPRTVNFPAGHLLLKCRKKAFSNRIVMTVPRRLMEGMKLLASIKAM